MDDKETTLVIQVLERTKTILEKQGFCKGSLCISKSGERPLLGDALLGREDLEMCLFTAFRKAFKEVKKKDLCRHKPKDEAYLEPLFYAIFEERKVDIIRLTKWNDEPERTLGDLLNAIQRAIDTEREK